MRRPARQFSTVDAVKHASTAGGAGRDAIGRPSRVGREREPIAVTATRSASTKHSVTGAKPDRKSTRLNSSHLGISYAVFCLKKKKRTQPTPLKPYRCTPLQTQA